VSRRTVPLAGELVLARLREQLEKLFQEVTLAGDSLPGAGAWSPAVDILETPEHLLILVEVPGLGPESLSVEIEGSALILSGQRHLEYGSGLKFHCLERIEGSFARRIQIFLTVDSNEAVVELSGGVLKIRLPKIQERRRRRRPIPIGEPEDEP
jgi:HSP20 family protein